MSIQCNACLFWICQRCAALFNNDYTSVALIPKPPHKIPSNIKTLHLEPQNKTAVLVKQKSTLSTQADLLKQVWDVLLEEGIGSFRNDVRNLQCIFTDSVLKNGKLEVRFQVTLWKTVVKCTQVLNRQRNPIFPSAPEEFSPQLPCVNITHGSPANSLPKARHILHLQYMERHQRLEKYTGLNLDLWWWNLPDRDTDRNH